ncbi:MAG: hypothetical protein ACFCUL_00215 [Flavobacteriaceae bacterium]
MKAVLHKIASMAMALLLLLSTTSWKVEKHYCMGRLINVALFVHVDDCGMGMDLVGNPESKLQNRNSCCDDNVVLIEGQDDLKISFNDLDVNGQTYFIGQSYTFSYRGLILTHKAVSQKTYPPPILVKDIQLLDEVFLI